MVPIRCVCTKCFRTFGQNHGICRDFVWFLEKLWRLYYEEETLVVTDEVPTKDNLTLHKTIKKVADDIENFSSIPQFRNS
jgi:leucyl-tRNA synthetase